MLQVDQQRAGMHDWGVAYGCMRVLRQRAPAAGFSAKVSHGLEAISACNRFVWTSRVRLHAATSFGVLAGHLDSCTGTRLSPRRPERAGQRRILLRGLTHGYFYAPRAPGWITGRALYFPVACDRKRSRVNALPAASLDE